MVRYPPLVLNLTQTHLCDTPFCNVSRDNCAIPHKKQVRKSFAILSLQVSRNMKSIAAGPLSSEGATEAHLKFVGAAECRLPKSFMHHFLTCPKFFIMAVGTILSESSLLCARIRTRRIGANPEKSDLLNFRGPD